MRRKANHSPIPLHERNKVAKTRPFALHEIRPAGTKNVLRWFKAKHGVKAKTVAEAWTWYRAYLVEQDAKVRRSDEQRRLRRIVRNHPWLASRLNALIDNASLVST